MRIGDTHQLEIRLCWPNPDAICLEGGCIHCAEGPDSRWVPLDDVHAYANGSGNAARDRHGRWQSLWNAFSYGLAHDWFNLPKRKLNVRRARAWSGTLTDRHYAGWEHMQRDE